MAYASIPALIGPTIGPLVGGFLTTYASWRWIFYINLPIGILGVVLTLRYIQSFTTPQPPAFDFRGFFMVGSGLGLLTLGIEHLARTMLPASELAGLFVASASLPTAYAYPIGRHHDRPGNRRAGDRRPVTRAEEARAIEHLFLEILQIQIDGRRHV